MILPTISADMAPPTLSVDLTTLVLIECPRCRQVLGENDMEPGASRYKCRHCHDWVVVLIPPIELRVRWDRRLDGLTDEGK